MYAAKWSAVRGSDKESSSRAHQTNYFNGLGDFQRRLSHTLYHSFRYPDAAFRGR